MDLTLQKVLDVSYSPVQWLASAKGTNTVRPASIDVSTFTAATHYPQGKLLSGLPLAQYTATAKSGQYGLYASGGSNGLGTCVGFLYADEWVSYTGGHGNYGATANTAIVIGGSLLWEGVVKKAALATILGASLPAGVLTDLASKFRFE